MVTGVYSVHIDAENQVVIVSGNVDSAILIKKLVRSGKYVELLSPSYYQILNQGKGNFIIDDGNRINGMNAPKTHYMFPQSLGSDVQDQWGLRNHLSQNVEMAAVRNENDENSMVATNENNYVGDYNDKPDAEVDMSSMMVPAAFQGNGANFIGSRDQNFGGFQDFYERRTGYENETPWYQYRHPSTEMMHANAHRPQMMNPIPQYNEFGFSLIPPSLY